MSTHARFQRSKISNLYLDTHHGIYYARCDGPDGKDTWRTLSTKSFEIAKRRLAAKLAEIQQGKTPRATNEAMETFAEVAELYRVRVQADVSLKASSQHYRLQTLDAILRTAPHIAELPPSKITEDPCLQWAKLYQKKVHPTRFNNTVGTLRAVFDLALELHLTHQNPAMKIGKLKVPSKKLVLPSREEFHQIVKTIASTGAWCAHDAAELVEFLAYSGVRITEAAFIRWSNVDGKAGTIRVYGHDENLTKNSEFRSIPILPPMRDLLDRIAARERFAPRKTDRVGQEFILHVIECREALAKACEKVGVKRLTHHDLRHLFATRCIESGVDIPTVSRWLGHKDGGALAMKVYGHLRDSHSQEMAAKVTF